MSAVAAVTAAPRHPSDEQSRARYPDQSGYAERNGVRTYYEVYGTGPETILLLPLWTIFHSRTWKGQIPYLARHFRVITFDGRGGGRSDSPSTDPADYSTEQVSLDALEVMNATGTDRAALIAFSRGVQYGLWLATERPQRVTALAVVTPSGFPASMRSLGTRLMLSPRVGRLLRRPLPRYPGRFKFHPRYMTERYRDFLRWFMSLATSDAHSSKVYEDGVAYASQSSAPVAAATAAAPGFWRRDELMARARAVDCPVLVMHGTKDPLAPSSDAKLLVRLTGGKLIPIRGVGHSAIGRYPVLVNLALRRFLEDSMPTDQ